MAARNDFGFSLGGTWVITLSCKDVNGAPLDLTNGDVQIRIATSAAVVFDLSKTNGVTILNPPTAGIARAVITKNMQDAAGIRAPAPLLDIPLSYDAKAVLIDGSESDQSYGIILVRTTLWQKFP